MTSKIKELYNQGIKVQVTTKDNKNEEKLCKKTSNPDVQCREDVFQVQLHIYVLNFSNNMFNFSNNILRGQSQHKEI